MSNDLSIENRESALVITFTNPETRNPLSSSVLERLHEIVDAAGQKGVIFTGSENGFASGANLREIAALTHETAPGFALRGQSLMSKIEALPGMTIAAINGFCFGGALDLALACERRIASPESRFAHPGAGLGIITGWGGTQRLPRLIGRGRALEMFFTAEPIGAYAALQMGLVDELSADPMARASGLVTQHALV
ncbi:MAG: enoyl-CoA hydratase/isomerase family protein [Pyrinomonadaceae bacterium]